MPSVYAKTFLNKHGHLLRPGIQNHFKVVASGIVVATAAGNPGDGDCENIDHYDAGSPLGGAWTLDYAGGCLWRYHQHPTTLLPSHTLAPGDYEDLFVDIDNGELLIYLIQYTAGGIPQPGGGLLFKSLTPDPCDYPGSTSWDNELLACDPTGAITGFVTIGKLGAATAEMCG